MNLKERTYLWYLAVLRVYIGYYLLTQGIRKYQRDFPKSDWIGRQIGDLANLELYAWYRRFMTDYVVPHNELFGYLVMIGEIGVGVCLLVGFFTRAAAAVGLFMVINYYLGPGMARGGAMVAQQQTFMIVLAIFILANPGRTAGLDGWLSRSRSKGKGAL